MYLTNLPTFPQDKIEEIVNYTCHKQIFKTIPKSMHSHYNHVYIIEFDCEFGSGKVFHVYSGNQGTHDT